MIKRELKVNLKGLCLWTGIILALFTVCFAIYPSIMNNQNSQMLNQMLSMFPEEVLKMFNMDLVGISSVFGFFQTEGIMFLTLLGSLYAATLGSSILTKEESDKTIEYLACLPIRRSRIVISKIVSGIINIFIFTGVVFIFNFIGLSLSNDLHLTTYLWLSLSPILLFIAVFLVTMLLSSFFKKTKTTMVISFAFVFISYFLQAIGNMGSNVEWIRYFSIFNLYPARFIISNNYLNLAPILIGSGIIIVSIILIFIHYNRKEFL